MSLYQTHPLQVYNSLSGKKENFKSIHEGQIGMYVCGPTVYSNVHLGNVRTFMSFDMIYRYLLVANMMVEIKNLQGTARVINYAGLVRGATQRVVKLEVIGNSDDELIEYLDDRNCLAKIEGADSATNSFKNLEEMLNAGYEHEILVSNNYIKISSIALSEDDNTTFHFLSWYVNEQKEEIVKFRDLISAYNNIGDIPERKYLMDKVFKPGMRFTWEEMIEKATGEKLTAKYYAKQFVN
jgi:hypothetical protein